MKELELLKLAQQITEEALHNQDTCIFACEHCPQNKELCRSGFSVKVKDMQEIINLIAQVLDKENRGCYHMGERK